MIPEIPDTLRLHGERAIMSSKEELIKRNKLSREILGLFGASAAVSLFFFGFLHVMTDSIVQSYCERMDLVLTEIQIWSIDSWIRSISLLGAGVLFVVLFLFLAGQKLAYLRTIIQGIEALRLHRMDHEMPLEGNNELTELAERINYLARTEKDLQQKEAKMRDEREQLIRALSHDIRTPLTSILSYSEYMLEKASVSEEELEVYLELMQQKAEQIKGLTDRLLDGSTGKTERIENGRFLMEQLADEWTTVLEDTFACEVDLENCPEFSGEFDVQDLRRIFDNLASNVEKYADPDYPVYLNICEKEGRLAVLQTNMCGAHAGHAESHGIGIDSIRRIAEGYGGHVRVEKAQRDFRIEILLQKLNE